jgi:hypothetical protein
MPLYSPTIQWPRCRVQWMDGERQHALCRHLLLVTESRGAGNARRRRHWRRPRPRSGSRPGTSGCGRPRESPKLAPTTACGKARTLAARAPRTEARSATSSVPKSAERPALSKCPAGSERGVAKTGHDGGRAMSPHDSSPLAECRDAKRQGSCCHHLEPKWRQQAYICMVMYI